MVSEFYYGAQNGGGFMVNGLPSCIECGEIGPGPGGIQLAGSLKGNAVKFSSAAQTATCLASGGVSNLLAGAPPAPGTPFWTLQTQSAFYAGSGGTTAIADLTFSPNSRLSGIVSSNSSPGTPNVLAQTSGKFDSYPCSNIAAAPGSAGNGFAMSLAIGGYSTQYEGVFANNNLSTAFVLSLVATGRPAGTDVFNGILTRW